MKRALRHSSYRNDLVTSFRGAIVTPRMARFRVKSATESVNDFRARINQAARDEEEGAPAGVGGDEWLLGAFRDRGSIHCDIWRGTAVDLAERDAIGVFPVAGWWKEKPFLNATMRWLATL